MMRAAVLIVACLLAASAARTARGEPAWGGSCLSCHGEVQAGLFIVHGEDGTEDPDESGTQAPDRGPLPVFKAMPGESRTFFIDLAGLSPDDTYAVAVRRFRFPGVQTGGTLRYTGDCAWPEWGEQANYFSNPVISYAWGAGPTTLAFELEVGLGTVYDYYDLRFAVAGKFADSGGLFWASEHVYLQAVLRPGDLDEDGDVDALDWHAFTGCVSGPNVASTPAGCDGAAFDAADLDADDDVDLADLAAFQAAFTGPPPAGAAGAPSSQPWISPTDRHAQRFPYSLFVLPAPPSEPAGHTD
jgi:hypothetical protein